MCTREFMGEGLRRVHGKGQAGRAGIVQLRPKKNKGCKQKCTWKGMGRLLSLAEGTERLCHPVTFI